ncbi:carboxymuconolactone decarboxylase family protein [Gordonia insulae]|uniref:Carboxymuconolactone decarboxylase-like domain-containing protein n=1 Tax=Gordonia insulae TaxID=2420509 RepID=A0A3G8JL31_9ACTN|nr:carboxymuconolactone decarboxylase family protein [Gordonia insulae]AZG45784.1 hypothetical protein D7316_02384 [Gordonia insulae]
MRLSPLPADQWDDAVNAALAGMLPRQRRNPQGAGNALATMVRNPELTRTFLPFNAHLLFGSTLPARLRELAVLRVAALCKCPYEVEHHTGMGLAAGLTLEEIADAQEGVAHDDLDRLVLAAATELDRESTLSDSTWSALAEHLDERQLIDLVFTVGTYATLAMAFNTFGIEPDRELQPEYER